MRVLCVVQLPPPVHGVSMMNSIVVGSDVIHSRFDLDVFPLRYSRSFKEFTSGTSFKKIFRMLAYYLRFVFRLLFHRPDLVYFTLTPCGGAFVRDSLFVFLAKFFHVRVVVHLHGKGICSEIFRFFLLCLQ